jgi:hypothetical protein
VRLGEPIRIAGAAAFLALALGGVVLREGQARSSGQEVALLMGPLDARDLTTRRVVELQLVEPLGPGDPCPPGTADQPDSFFEWFGDGPVGWVALREDGGRWRAAGWADTREAAARLGPVVVRGRAGCRAGGVEFDLGLKRFHAGRREAASIERLLQRGDGRAEALISVGRDGRARLKGVRVDGRRVELEWF